MHDEKNWNIFESLEAKAIKLRATLDFLEKELLTDE